MPDVTHDTLKLLTNFLCTWFWYMCVNKVNLHNESPTYVDRRSVRQSVCPEVRHNVSMPASRLKKRIHSHYLKNYNQCSHETLHNGTFEQGPPDHTTLSDLDPRSLSQRLIKNLEKSQLLTFVHTLWPTCQWNLTQCYLWLEHTSIFDLNSRSRLQRLIKLLINCKSDNFKTISRYRKMFS